MQTLAAEALCKDISEDASCTQVAVIDDATPGTRSTLFCDGDIGRGWESREAGGLRSSGQGHTVEMYSLENLPSLFLCACGNLIGFNETRLLKMYMPLSILLLSSSSSLLTGKNKPRFKASRNLSKGTRGLELGNNETNKGRTIAELDL